MQLNKNQFENYITALREYWITNTRLHRLGVDIQIPAIDNINKCLVHAVFNEAEIAIIDWWLFGKPNAIDLDEYNFNFAKIYKKNNPKKVVATLDSMAALYDYLLTLEENHDTDTTNTRQTENAPDK